MGRSAPTSRRIAIAVSLPVALLACSQPSPTPPEPALSLPPAARLDPEPARPEVLANLQQPMVFHPAGFPEIRLGSWQPPQTDESLCCGYEEREMILVSTGGVTTQVEAFRYGGWEHIDVLGDRIWALEQSSVIEAGSGPIQIAYSPDRGRSWFQLAEIPDPSEDILGQPAPVRAFTMQPTGRGTLVLELADDDEAYAECLESFFARVQRTLGGHPCPGAAKGDYEYRTADFGRTWTLRSRP